MATFEWRASNGQQTNGPKDTGEGCLFAIISSSEQTTTSAPSLAPTLTLVPPLTTTTTTQSPTIQSSNGALITPAPGDDLSPPNSVQAEKINGIAVPVTASAGWSVSPPRKDGIYPSCVAYDVKIKTNNNNTKNNNNNNNNKNNSAAIHDSLELAVALEYTNPRFESCSGESMVVKVAVAKTLVNEELGTELALVTTNFQEFVPEKNQWIDITADVDYTQTANAIVDAVLEDPNAGQTAGKATVTAKTVELTLGPFSAKARLNLTFQADRLYTYDAMSVRPDAADIGSHRLLPLWLNLPFAPVNQEAGLSNLAVRVQAPSGTAVLPVDQYQEAYWNLKNQDDMKSTTVLAVSNLKPTGNADLVGCQFQWESLPPRSTGLLAWLALPNSVTADDSSGIFDFVHIGRSLENLANPPTTTQTDPNAQAQVTLQVPDPADASSLQVPLPGHGPMGNLYRLKVMMPKAQPRQQPYFILNLTLSDKSGSTSRRVGNASMRDRFNQLAEVRFLKRLESIPALVKANVLRMDDVWMEAFLAFDDSAPAGSIKKVMFRVSDVQDAAIETVQAIRSGNNFAANRLPAVLQHVQALRGISPGGLTDFSVGPKTLVQVFSQWQRDAQALAASASASASAVTPCAFVEFDTDGGHNSGSGYLDALRNLCNVYDVRDGVVTGFGSWLNQDCASKVARVLGSVPALLALQVPEPGTEGLDKVFRTGFAAWIGALRKPPKLTLKLTAGSVSFPSPVASRNANAVEVLGFRRIGEESRHDGEPKFGAPDVSNETYTKTVIAQVPAGAELLFYIVSRLPSPTELERVLEVQCSVDESPNTASAASRGRVWSEDETSAGNFLAYDWLSMLTKKSGSKAKGYQLAPLMTTSLSSRLEDEVSFRFNIASPSGKTSYLGRCKTVPNRPPIDAAHQPEPPSCPMKARPRKTRATFEGCWAPPAASTPTFQSSSFKFSNFGGASVGGGGFGGGGFGGAGPQVGGGGGGRRIRPGARPQVGGGGGGRRIRPDGFHSSSSDPRLQVKYGHAGNGVHVTTYSSAPEVTRSVGGFAAPPPVGLFGGPPSPGAPGLFGAPGGFGGLRCAASPTPGGFGAPPPSGGLFISAAPPSPAACPPPPGQSGGFSFAAASHSRRGSFGGGAKVSTSPPERPKEPSWRDALEIPVGSDVPLDKQDYEELLNAMSQVVHARQRLQNDPSVNFVCDVCGRQFLPREPRYHCFDCLDFDACSQCKDTHNNKPFHRLAVINPPSAAVGAVSSLPEDPLVASLLHGGGGGGGAAPLTGSSALLQTTRPKFDQTEEWCKQRVQRFLLAILHWWPVFRATCSFREQLPASLGNEMAEKIVQSFNNHNNNNNMNDVLETVTIIVDSLMREAAAMPTTTSQQPPTSHPGILASG